MATRHGCKSISGPRNRSVNRLAALVLTLPSRQFLIRHIESLNRASNQSIVAALNTNSLDEPVGRCVSVPRRVLRYRLDPLLARILTMTAARYLPEG